MWRGGSVRIAEIGGIAVDVHFTFALVIAWAGWTGWAQYGGIQGVGFGVLIVLLLFFSVLVHEFGHGLVARAFGLVVRRITVLPIGGLAQLETPPSYPRHELIITLAGPLANLALAVLFGGVLFAIDPLQFDAYSVENWIIQFFLIPFLSPSMAGLALYMLGANLVLFLFNMLPAFPMDGGRVLRAGLALVIDYELATQIAAWLGRIMALAMAALGIIGWPPTRIPPNPLLLVVAAVVYFGARHEEIFVRRRRALLRLEARDIMQRDGVTLEPWDMVTPEVAQMLIRHDRALPVVVDRRATGLLAFEDVRHLGEEAFEKTIAHVMRTDFPTLSPGDTLWVALQEMMKRQLAALPVVHNELFQGMGTLDDIHHAWRFAPRSANRPDPNLAPGDSVSQ